MRAGFGRSVELTADFGGNSRIYGRFPFLGGALWEVGACVCTLKTGMGSRSPGHPPTSTCSPPPPSGTWLPTTRSASRAGRRRRGRAGPDPDASGCLVYTLLPGGVLDGRMYGPTTKVVTVEADFESCPFRFFFVEFRPGGLSSFTPIPSTSWPTRSVFWRMLPAPPGAGPRPLRA